MPYQNRVDPYGRLHAVTNRGGWVGNRGVLINDRREVVRPFRLQRWITCSLQFKDRHREVFTPRRWTELFFLDEVTAMAAGHRPCAECRRERYNAFKAAWPIRHKTLAEEMDAVLHAERLTAAGDKKTYEEESGKLPDGTMIELEGKAVLISKSRLWWWTFAGYEPYESRPLTNESLPLTDIVTVLTPKSIVQVLKNGYLPEIFSRTEAY